MPPQLCPRLSLRLGGSAPDGSQLTRRLRARERRLRALRRRSEATTADSGGDEDEDADRGSAHLEATTASVCMEDARANIRSRAAFATPRLIAVVVRGSAEMTLPRPTMTAASVRGRDGSSRNLGGRGAKTPSRPHSAE